MTKKGRKRVGSPISITLTPGQQAWIESRIKSGQSRSEVMREVINEAMAREKKKAG